MSAGAGVFLFIRCQVEWSFRRLSCTFPRSVWSRRARDAGMAIIGMAASAGPEGAIATPLSTPMDTITTNNIHFSRVFIFAREEEEVRGG